MADVQSKNLAKIFIESTNIERAGASLYGLRIGKGMLNNFFSLIEESSHVPLIKEKLQVLTSMTLNDIWLAKDKKSERGNFMSKGFCFNVWKKYV
jgi:hypothetical protein